ncbi:MAG: M48 family metalloprotease [Gammaproteobacteria bacterium]|nr:M48 family metalloprotease [Gammaproteobacteria bacterium]
MKLLAVAVALASCALAALLWIRSKCDGEEPGPRTNGIAWAGSFALSAATVLGIVAALPNLLAGLWVPAEEGWLLIAVFGAYYGVGLYVLFRLVFIGITTQVRQWACRLPPENDAPTHRRLLVEVCVFVGFVIAAVAMLLVAYSAARLGLPPWTMFPLCVAALPLYNTFLVPWIQYLRAPSLSSYDLGDISGWLDDLSRDRQLSPFRVRVHEGRLVNAFATGGLGVHLVVLGATLLERMSPAEIRAVLAHEVAHIEKGHVPKLVLPLIVLGGTLNLICVTSFSNPLFDTGEVLYFLAGVAVVLASATLFLVCLPGYFMRRMELEADRVAVEILGDGELLVRALTKLAELNNQPMTTRSWSHPSMQARIEAIRAPAPATA